MAANSNPKLSATRMSARISFIILILAIVHSNDRSPVVKCQDFEDLNRPTGGNAAGLGGSTSPQQQQQQPQAFAAFQPSRQFGQSQAQPSNQFQAPQNTRQSPQRPVLSNRFAQQQQPQLGAQASTLSSAVLPSQQQQQQTLPTTLSGQQSTPAASAPGNVEQIMKSAQNRASKLELTNSAESRQEPGAASQIQSRSGAQFQPAQTPASQSPKERSLPSSAATSSSESRAGEPSLNPSSEEPTTTTETTTTAHETVYSDQRFASLFARRGSQKKSKFMPTEQVKAKPTLPSFIKSPPDPKQFTPEAQETRPSNQVSTNLISARIQQQQSINQNRQSINQSTQKKPVAGITSNTAASANNKRLNSQKQQAAASTPLKASNASRAAGSQQSAPVANKPNPVNPFNKSQQSNSDPANVIAMARRRLLANNALQQQQRPTVK